MKRGASRAPFHFSSKAILDRSPPLAIAAIERSMMMVVFALVLAAVVVVAATSRRGLAMTHRGPRLLSRSYRWPLLRYCAYGRARRRMRCIALLRRVPSRTMALWRTRPGPTTVRRARHRRIEQPGLQALKLRIDRHEFVQRGGAGARNASNDDRIFNRMFIEAGIFAHRFNRLRAAFQHIHDCTPRIAATLFGEMRVVIHRLQQYF